MIYSAEGMALTKHFEGCRLEAYRDEGGVWTIGYGHTVKVKKGDTCTQEQANAWLEQYIGYCAKSVNEVKVPMTQGQFDALVDFTYNAGMVAFTWSTLLKKLNAGDYDGAANEFPRWNHVNGKVSKGLTARRLAEQKMFRGEPWR